MKEQIEKMRNTINIQYSFPKHQRLHNMHESVACTKKNVKTKKTSKNSRQ